MPLRLRVFTLLCLFGALLVLGLSLFRFLPILVSSFGYKSGISLFLLLFILSGAVVVLLLDWPRFHLGKRIGNLNEFEQLEAENAARQTLAQILAGAFLLLGVVFTGQQLAYTGQTLRIQQNTQFTQSFAEAIGLLGDQSRRVRVGGILLLGRIAEESPEDKDQIVGILLSYVRQPPPFDDVATPADERFAPIDVQAAITVLKELALNKELEEGQENIDLREARLAQVDLSEAHLEEADLALVDLSNANLEGTQFDRAHLENAGLYGQEGSLKNADLSGAHLEQAYLGAADLTGAKLVGAQLDNQSDIYDWIRHGADLQGRETLLVGTDFADANLKGVCFQGTDPSHALNLDSKQLEEAILDSKTILPPEFASANIPREPDGIECYPGDPK